MAMRHPIWTWRSDSVEPILAGNLELQDSGASFTYVPTYCQAHGGRALDPCKLKLGGRAFRFPGETVLPGVLLDAMPSGFSRDQLESQYGRTLGNIEALELSAPDAVGGIELRSEAPAKPRACVPLAELLIKLEGGAGTAVVLERLGDRASTSLGGERPKLTVEHKGALWIAKLQAAGDAPHCPAREYVAMVLAKELGINIPEVEFYRPGGQEVFLVKRFDRAGDPLRPLRHLFASAHTVLGLSPDALPGDPSRSYLSLAKAMRRWVQDEDSAACDAQQLWHRMVLNALVGNADDHPRNHGLLNTGERWRLSPAYDITSLSTFRRALAMGVDQRGSTDCSVQRLVSVAEDFGVRRSSAEAWLARAAQHIAENWQKRLRACGVSEEVIVTLESAFSLSIEYENES